MSKEPYYITTAITYTSGKPHIGNTYEIILADSIARYKSGRAGCDAERVCGRRGRRDQKDLGSDEYFLR